MVTNLPGAYPLARRKEEPPQDDRHVYDTAEKECNIKHDALHMGGPPSDNVAIDLAGEQSLVRLATIGGFIGLADLMVVPAQCEAGGHRAHGRRLQRHGQPGVRLVLGRRDERHRANDAVAGLRGRHLGAIHLANYYRDAIHESGLEGAAMRAIQHAWLPLSLATGTTAVGLLTLCYSELVPIQLFGFYSAVGVVFSLLFLFFFMPAAFQRWPLTDEANGTAEAPAIDPAFFGGWDKIGDWIIGHNGHDRRRPGGDCVLRSACRGWRRVCS